ncbi:MAG: endonuclease/exonuclease/phosphatase family protein [Bacteroidales bacterium]|nr:endonuclease/exonuclease/phosphatase family protein [Bacteroidales bacterium]
MKRLFKLFSVSILLIFASCTGSKHLPTQQNNAIAEFKMASYNIRCDVQADVKSGNAWDLRKKPLTDLIINHHFDMVGVQEPYGNQIEDLQNLLTDYDYVSAPYATKSFLAIFYKKNLFDLLENDMFWLSETPDVKSMGWDADEYRIVHWAKFRHKESEKEFYCFNSHFYWKKVTARQNSGPLTAQKIKEIAGDYPVVFVGDLNSQPETSQIQSLKVLLNDAFDVTESPRKGPENTNLGGGVFQGNPYNRIDYIFVSKNIKVVDYTSYEDKYGDAQYPSDHLAISSNIVIK